MPAKDHVGYYSPNENFFSLRAEDGSIIDTFNYGAGSSTAPIAGDWDGDGDEEVGYYTPDKNFFSLRADDGTVSFFNYGTG